ncbi:hydrogenase [Aggregatibacter actinomycetemcomitans]|nr:hydrogenase [Aggregatibacter actinomycetemcomitans]
MFWLYIFKVLLFFNFINIDKQPYTDTKKHHKKTTALFTPLTSVEAPLHSPIDPNLTQAQAVQLTQDCLRMILSMPTKQPKFDPDRRNLFNAMIK